MAATCVRVFALVALVLGLTLTMISERMGASQMGRVPSTTVRFHHAHYAVGDPSAAMTEAARRLEGVRVIVQGLGVGVRAGREFLLFDRVSDAASRGKRMSATQAYPAALRRLREWGLSVEPQDALHARVMAAMGDLSIHHLGFAAVDFEAAVQQITAAGTTVIARRDDSLLFDAGGGLFIEIVHDTDREETFWCPMHPDVRSADDGKCPICGMPLVPIPPPKIGEYNLDIVQVRNHARATTGLVLTVREPETDARATKFALVHERLLHLFIVSRDLRYFAHVHPEAQADGSFSLTHALPGGEYMLIADFIPQSGTPQMIQKAIIVEGPLLPLEPTDDSNGLKVAMQVDGEPVAGKEAKLTFTVTDAKSARPVTDLQPYLGAPAHMLIVRTDLSDAIHAHPDEREAAGPSVSFHPLMPAPGAYKLWIQFQRNGQVSTSAFDLIVSH